MRSPPPLSTSTAVWSPAPLSSSPWICFPSDIVRRSVPPFPLLHSIRDIWAAIDEGGGGMLNGVRVDRNPLPSPLLSTTCAGCVNRSPAETRKQNTVCRRPTSALRAQLVAIHYLSRPSRPLLCTLLCRHSKQASIPRSRSKLKRWPACEERDMWEDE